MTITVRGERTESFINLVTSKRIQVWEVRSLNGQGLSMNILLSDFFRLRPLLKQTSCKMHTEARHGFPFLLHKLGRRKAFITGFLLFLVGLYMLSSLVWNVKVMGNVNIPEEEILMAAKQEGIYPLQWSFRMNDQEMLAKRLAQRIPGIAWVGVEKQGTHITIRVVETTKPETVPPLSPRHLVAKTDAVVTDIFTEQGRPKVKKNSRVKKGSILISGVIGSEENPQIVVAKGKVKGLVWHEYQIGIPLVQNHKTYTGEWKERNYVVTGDRALQISGYGKIPYENYEIVADQEYAKIGSYQLPVGWMKEKVMEVHLLQQSLTETDAKNIGLEHARADVSAKNGPNAQIQAEKILHQEIKNGKVYLNVLFEVEQWIAEELPIVHN